METKHTHGPWKASSNGLIFGGNFATTQICDTGWCFWSNRLHELMQSDIVPPDKTQEFLRENIEISKANAKLIAAAPEMATELKETADWLINLTESRGLMGHYTELRESIRKQAESMLSVYKKATD